jgi:hypothetical protein
MKQSDWCKQIKGDCWHPNEIAEWRLQDDRWFGLMGWYTLAYADCPYGKPGDQLWLREAWRTYASLDGIPPRDIAPGAGIQYEALGTSLPGDKGDYLLGMGRYRPSMFMPRWASRILLEITSVRVERLLDISEADAQAEGVERRIIGEGWREYGLDKQTEACGTPPLISAKESFYSLWESINGPGSWDANPWVWCIEFKKVTV